MLNLLIPCIRLYTGPTLVDTIIDTAYWCHEYPISQSNIGRYSICFVSILIMKSPTEGPLIAQRRELQFFSIIPRGMAQMTFLATQLTWINEVAKKNYKLPEGVCFWQQGSLLANIPTGPSAPNCPFQVRSPVATRSVCFLFIIL